MKGTGRYPWLIPLSSLMFAALACSLLSAKGPTAPGGSAPPIETAVAATVQALQHNPTSSSQPGTGLAAATQPPSPNNLAPTTTPTTLPALLPSGLYFIGPDRSGLGQVWRLTPKGSFVEQMTAEPAGVTDFAVSSDGKIAYIVNNQLILKRPGFDGTAVIADGGKDDGTDVFLYTKKITDPAWSTDGLTLAYAQDGINLYHPATGVTELALQDKLERKDNFYIVRGLYTPLVWSPDGNRLAVHVSWEESGTQGIFTPNDNQLIELKKTNNDPASCCTVAWTPDGKSLLSAGFHYYGVNSADLWRYVAADGKGSELIPSQNPDGTYNYVDWPMLAPDGKLYYFYTDLVSPANGPVAYQMVRSEPDGKSARTVLQADPLLVSEALWAPDASLAVVVIPSPGGADSNTPSHGEIAILYSDGRPMRQIVADGRGLMWGP